MTRTDENNEPIRFRTENGLVYNYDPSLGADLSDEMNKAMWEKAGAVTVEGVEVYKGVQ
jgi:hypothetical protein